LAENEDVVRRIGWTTVAEDQGVAGGRAGTISRHPGGGGIASAFGSGGEQIVPFPCGARTPGAGWALVFPVGMPVGRAGSQRLLAPILAEPLAGGGLDKAALGRRLFEAARMPAWKFERLIGEWTNLVPGRPSLVDLVRAGRAPAVFAESTDPERLVPVVCRP